MTNAAELLRLIHNLIRLGIIEQVDHDAARVRVKSGENLTGWLMWISFRAGTTRDWSPPTLGEQVIIFSPGGDLAAGIVLTGLNSDVHTAPSSSADVWRREFPDGAVAEYNHVTQLLTLMLPGESTMEVTSTSITINGDVQLNGNFNATGEVSDGTRTMSADRAIYNEHTHKENDVGAQTDPADAQQ